MVIRHLCVKCVCSAPHLDIHLNILSNSTQKLQHHVKVSVSSLLLMS